MEIIGPSICLRIRNGSVLASENEIAEASKSRKGRDGRAGDQVKHAHSA
jgi:hypothetical protein